MPLYNASGAVRVRVATGTTFCGAYHPDGALWVTEAQGTSWTGRTAPDGSMYVTLAVGAVRGRYAPNGSVYVSQNPNVDGATYIEIVSGSLAGFIDGATLDMNFASNLYLGAAPSNLTVSRASTGYAETVEGTLTSFAANTARITNKGLLVEESRTNTFLQSQNFASGTWTKENQNGTTSAIAAPDGTLTAWEVSHPVSASLPHRVIQIAAATLGVTYTVSVLVRPDTGTQFFQIAFGSADFGVNAYANFDIVNGALGTVGSAVTGTSITRLANGWVRVSVSAPCTATGTAGAFFGRVSSSTAVRGENWTGNNEVYQIWGAQWETGTFPTSYIPTTTVAVTRAADSIILDGTAFTNIYNNAPAYTLYVETDDLQVRTNNKTLIGVAGAANEYTNVWAWGGSPELPTAVRIFSRGSTAAQIGTIGSATPLDTPPLNGSIYKFAHTITVGDGAGAANGTIAKDFTVDALTMPVVTRMVFGRGSENTGDLNTFGVFYIRRAAFIPSRLSNSALELLTTIPPTLSMDFTTGTYVGATPANFTFSRASDGYAEDANGVWSVFASGVPRITSKGLLVEEARTNVVRNSSNTGAVVGTPGTLPTNWSQSQNTGLVFNVVGTGVDNGLDYVDLRLQGTTTGSGQVNLFFDSNAFTAADLQSWTISSFISLLNGSTANLTSVWYIIEERTAADAAIRTNISPDLIPQFVAAPFGTNRPSYSVQLTGGGTVGLIRHRIQINIGTGQSINMTLRIGMPQIEQGAFATSPIRTTSAAVTRAADVVSLTGANFTSWYTGAGRTIFGEAFLYTVPAASVNNPVLASIDDGTGNNRIQIRRADNNGNPFGTGIMIDGGVAQANISSAFGQTFQPGKIAMAFAVNSVQQATNGLLGTEDTVATIPAAVTQLQLGNGPSAFYVNGYIRKFDYYPVRLANNVLQSITT